MKEGFYHRASCQLELAGGFRTVSFFHGFGHGDLSLVFKEWIWIPALLWIGSNNFRKDLGLFWFSFGSGFGLFLEDVGFFIRLFQLSKKEEVD